LGQPLVLLGYVVGVTALAFHLALGVVRFAQRRGGDARLARYAAGAVALLLWLGYLQVLGRFAIGEGLIPTASDKRGSSHASERDGNDRDH
ncbi:MAG TPA: hypothetical protein VHM19_06510, partial [Polyangiales bacterium]|nr:hypothetical protein [Polyangiales bacterium]